MIDTSFANHCTDDEMDIEMAVVANPESGFLTAEEAIQKKILGVLLSVPKTRDNNVGKLYLLKFVIHSDNETSIVIDAARPVFREWKFFGWDTKGCVKAPHFYVQEILKPDPQMKKILRRKLMDTPFNMAHIKHFLKGYQVQEVNGGGSSKYASLIYRTVRMAKNQLLE